jgi:hypothetical protein
MNSVFDRIQYRVAHPREGRTTACSRRRTAARLMPEQAGIKFRSTVRGPVDMQINREYGGSMIYWNEPDGHQWEVLTVSYARQAK